MNNYFEQMTAEVEDAAKTMGIKELNDNILNCNNILSSGGIDHDEVKQIEKERSIYEAMLNKKLGIFPGSGHGIHKPN